MKPLLPTPLLLLVAATPAAAELQVSVDEGVVYEDAGRRLRLDLDGRFALDYVHYDERNVRPRQGRLDRALLGASATWREVFEARVVADLTGIDTRYGLWEGWVSARHERVARLTLGLLPIALGVEHSLREGARPTVGYPGFPAFLTDRSDVAAQLDGELAEGFFSYDLSAALGEGFDLFGQRRGDPMFAGRLTTYPFRWLDWSVELGPYAFPLLSGVFASFGYAWTPDYDGHLDIATPLRNKLFDTSRLDGRSSRYRTIGLGADLGPLRVTWESTLGSLLDVRAPGGGRVDFDGQIGSWQIVASARLTGEPYDSRPFRQRHQRRPPAPRRPFVGDDGRWFAGPGLVELAFAYGNADLDRAFQELGFLAFNPKAPPFEDEPFTSSQEFRTATVALNWGPTASLRLSFEVVRVIADQFPAVFDSHGRDTSALLRVQYTF